MNALTLMPGFFYRLGLDVILYELPYHGRRRPAQAGTDLLFPSGNLPLTNEAFAQSIFELRALRAWIAQETNSNKVGAIGMSLGGYTAALWAGLDRLDFVIPVVPFVSLPDFVHSVATELSSSLELSSPRLLEQIYRVHSPLRFRPKVSRAGRLIIAARDDRILPPTHALALSNHWDQTEILWLEGGHLDQLTASIALNRIHQLLLSLGLAEREPFRMEF